MSQRVNVGIKTIVYIFEVHCSISSTCLHAAFLRERQKSCLFLKTNFTLLFHTKNSYENCAGWLKFAHSLGKKNL
jgi:hypothetical protein